MLGAIIGDVVGSRFEFNNIKSKKFRLTGRGTSMTDDSIMTIAVDECCANGYDTDGIIDTLKYWGRKYPRAGYGYCFYNWVLGTDREPYYSCGNGSAMRVSAAGWFGNSEAEVKAISKAVTEVTHNHPEGIKGAEVVAMCIYYAKNGKSKDFIREYVEQYYDLDFDYEELRATYKHEYEICQVTVPQAIYCFLISDSFEDCLRTTISIGGDCDTTAAMSCAIAEAYYGGIDKHIVEEVSFYIDKPVSDMLRYTYGKIYGKNLPEYISYLRN